jgi:hypothetical protein
LQRACEIQVATLAMGAPVMISDEVVDRHMAHLHQAQIDPAHVGAPEFEAMIRLVDQKDKSWRD